MADKKNFAAVPKQMVDNFVSDLDDLRAGMILPSEPHYDEKALTLFLLLRFHANCSFDFYTNEYMLCELMRLSTRAENRESIMLNILRMQEDELLTIKRYPGKKFFCIDLNYEVFMTTTDFVKIYKEEYDALISDKSRDKLFLILYCVKKFRYGKSDISFPSVETIMDSSHISKPTICKGLEKLDGVLYIYKARINFNDGTSKDVNYYKPRAAGSGISREVLDNIVKKYYSNVKSITERK